jgi:hypothetical protein
MDYEVVTFSERFTEGSSLYQNGFDSPTLYKVTAKENYLLLPERDSSTLFYFYGNDTLNLQPSNPINLTQEFCVLLTPDSTFIGDDIGHIEEFQFFEEVLVDQYAVSCIPSIIAVEDGYLVYDKNGLNASFVSFERDFLSGIKPMEGWKKLK